MELIEVSRIYYGKEEPKHLPLEDYRGYEVEF